MHQISKDPAAGDSGKRNFSIAFGLERIGLIALRAPRTAAVVLLALVVIAVFGIQRIKIDDSLSQLFRSDTPEYKQYEEVTKRFPSSEYDVLVVVEGKSLLERNSLEKLRDLVTDLQLVDGTRGIISLFSARQPPEGGRLPAALFPETLPEGAEYDAFIKRVRDNEVIKGKLLSEDGTLALFRPEQNARRFNESARRMAMPDLPEELFLESIRQVIYRSPPTSNEQQHQEPSLTPSLLHSLSLS